MKRWKHVNGAQSILWLNILRESQRVYHFSITDSEQGIIVQRETSEVPEQMYDNLQSALSRLTDPNGGAEPKAFADFGKLLFRVTSPEAVQEVIASHQGPVVFATEELSLPWELLHDGEKFLCLDRAFARMPGFYSLAEKLFGSTPYNSQGRALIIADPAGNLPAALGEVHELREIFDRHGVPCDCLVGPDQCSYLGILSKINEGGYDVIHFSGHIQCLAERQASGIVLAGGKLLMGEDICRALRGNPLAFLNACHGSSLPQGTATGEPHCGARNVRTMAQAFAHGNKSGRARAVIGSMWWVNDDVTRGLAVEFYQHLLQGQTLGTSLLKARTHIAQTQTDPALWSCYVLFGHPMLALQEETAAAVPVAPQPGADVPAPPPPQAAVAAPVEPPPAQTPDEMPGLDLSELEGPWSDDLRVALLGSVMTMSAMNWSTFSSVHLLLGLTYLDEGLVGRALRDKGIDPTHARRKIRSALRQDAPTEKTAGFTITPNARWILGEAKRLAEAEPSPEILERHILKAAMERPNSIFWMLMDGLKLDLNKLKRDCDPPNAPDAVDRTAAPKAPAAPVVQTPPLQPEAPPEHPPQTPVPPQGHSDLFHPSGYLDLDMFSTQARGALDMAAESALTTHWEEIRSPHIFLGLLQLPQSKLESRLRHKGVDPLKLADMFCQSVGKLPRLTLKKPLLHREMISDNAMRVLRQAHAAAGKAGHAVIEEGDLLGTILLDEKGFVNQWLKSCRLNPLDLLPPA